MFRASCHRKMFIANMFKIRQGPSESLKDHLALFSEATIRVIPPNQEIFVGELQNGLKARHFNESISHKPALSLAEVVAIDECYIKGEESNSKKKACGVKEHIPTVKSRIIRGRAIILFP